MIPSNPANEVYAMNGWHGISELKPRYEIEWYLASGRLFQWHLCYFLSFQTSHTFIIQTSIFTKLFHEIYQIDEKMAAEADIYYSKVKKKNNLDKCTVQQYYRVSDVIHAHSPSFTHDVTENLIWSISAELA